MDSRRLLINNPDLSHNEPELEIGSGSEEEFNENTV